MPTSSKTRLRQAYGYGYPGFAGPLGGYPGAALPHRAAYYGMQEHIKAEERMLVRG